jgi:hypothetical protein
MTKITEIRHFEDSNSYSGMDGFELYATTADGTLTEFNIKLLRSDLSTKAMRLLAEHLDRFADAIDGKHRGQKGKPR